MTTLAPQLDIYDEVIIELRRVLKLGRALTHRQVSTIDGVAPALFGVLSVLNREGPKRTSVIAETLHVDISVVSRQVAELEQLGLVNRNRDATDARAHLIAVTEAGASTVRRVRARQHAITKSVLAKWDSDDLRTFVANLRRFADDIEQPEKPRKTCMTSTVDDATSPSSDQSQEERMTHREVLTAMSGLLMAMFVAMLSGTIVANALPRIIAELGGNQSQYTWVVTATLLAATATTPIWGKMSDRVNKKLLIQLSITVFVLGSILAGFSQNTEMLIGWRAVQGLGLGGLQALVQIVMASIVSPRERGRYMGYFGAVMAVATVGGPLLGGFLVDADALGWRWTFWVGAPVAAVALIVLQKTLHLPVVQRERSSIDWLGAMLIPGGVSVLLIWVTLAGKNFDWISAPSALLVVGALVLLAAAVVVERHAADPIVPPRLMRNRTVVLAIMASAAVGVAMFGSGVFFGQYFQISRGYSPTESGLLTLPMVTGLLVSSTIFGRLVTRSGRWKPILIAGTGLIVIGLGLLATIDHATSIPLIGVFMAVLGIGVGMTMQNLVLAAQNSISFSDLGAGTSTVTFFRSLGGAAGVSVLGAILASRVGNLIADRLSGIPGAVESTQSGGSTSLDVRNLPEPVRVVVEQAYGDGTALVFLISAVVAAVAFVAVFFIREANLRTTVE